MEHDHLDSKDHKVSLKAILISTPPIMNPSLPSNFSTSPESREVDNDEEEEEEYESSDSDQLLGPHQTVPEPILIRMAMRVSRSKWFNFLRRVFQYQNRSRSQQGTNPFDTSGWRAMECATLVLQICLSVLTLSVSKEEKPVWPMRLWLVGYDGGCVISLLILLWRYRHNHLRRSGDDGLNLTDLEQQSSNEESRSMHLVNKCKESLDLFFAMWFVTGNVWMFDTRFRTFGQAPKLHVICIGILGWNAILYSFPFLLFLLLCICVPLASNLIGYNMSMGAADKGASDDQISRLLSWRYKEVQSDGFDAASNSSTTKDNPECCICLTKYKDKDEIRQLPCSHIFHQKCVDHWLKIISCCPLCKQGLDR